MCTDRCSSRHYGDLHEADNLLGRPLSKQTPPFIRPHPRGQTGIGENIPPPLRSVTTADRVWMSMPLNLHSKNDKVPFVGPRPSQKIVAKRQKFKVILREPHL